MTKEQPEEIAKKISSLLEKFEKIVFFVCFLQLFPLFIPNSELLRLLFAQVLFFKERS